MLKYTNMIYFQETELYTIFKKIVLLKEKHLLFL